jgi:SAM-dependent methyltransferase
MSDDHTWGSYDWIGYYDEYGDREPRELLLETLARFDGPGDAVDLGCGVGIDAAAMLAGGWSVFATDAQEEAIARLLARVSAEERDRLRVLRSRMEDVELPVADLVWASFSLFFCDPPTFPAVWGRIRGGVRPGGRFAGQLLGDRDTWAPQGDITAFRREEAEALFDGWTLERFEEEEYEADADPKHWHLFHAVARAPGGRP